MNSIRLSVILGLLTGSLLTVSAEPQAAAEVEQELEKFYFSQPHLGTMVQIAFYGSDQAAAKTLSKQCFARIVELNKTFSDYLEHSEVSQLCAKPLNQAHKVSDELLEVLIQAQKISAATNGAFDITIGRASKRWRKGRLKKQVLTDDKPVEVSYRDLVIDPKAKTVTLHKQLQIDLGGIAKGYIADELMKILKKGGIKQGAVIIGGEMVFSGAPPNKKGWIVGIERPSHKLLGTLSLSNTALSTSGDSYQFYEADGKRHAHLIDPKSGKAKTNRLNVTTIATTAMLADSWATALRVSDQESAIKLAQANKEIEAAFVPFGKDPVLTEGFPKIEKR